MLFCLLHTLLPSPLMFSIPPTILEYNFTRTVQKLSYFQRIVLQWTNVLGEQGSVPLLLIY